MLKNLTPKHKKVKKRIFEFLKKENYYLAGGTAVYYYLNHRKSDDLDFFTEEKKNFSDFMDIFKKYEILYFSDNTIHLIIEGIKTSFFIYPYKLLKKFNYLEDLKIASLEDILCMKISSVLDRGSRKDFYDLYFILNHLKISKKEIYLMFFKKFGNFNPLIINKGLLYFSDAEKEPELKLIKRIKWKEVKDFFIENFSKF